MAEPQIQRMIEHICRHLVDEPDEVRVDEVEGRRVTVYEVTVADKDRGKVIGKQGRIANAIRTVAKAAASQNGQHVAVEIIT